MEQTLHKLSLITVDLIFMAFYLSKVYQRLLMVSGTILIYKTILTHTSKSPSILQITTKSFSDPTPPRPSRKTDKLKNESACLQIYHVSSISKFPHNHPSQTHHATFLPVLISNTVYFTISHILNQRARIFLFNLTVMTLLMS